jgi:putative flippase GtrA
MPDSPSDISLKSLLGGDFVRKFWLYFAVGGISALLDWALFALFLYGADLHYLISATLSFIIATGVNYVLSVKYVFQGGRRSRGEQIFLVYFASGVGILINLIVLSALIEFVGLHPMVAKLVGTGSTFGWNFGARYYWIFAGGDRHGRDR